MRIVQTSHDIRWLPIPNEIALILDNELPPTHLITSAFALAFQGRSILMTNLNSRGWDIPGGHLEPGESPEEAVRREVVEETGVQLADLRFFGYQHIRLLAPCPSNYRHPYPDSYQTFFLATVANMPEFSSTEETRGRTLFPPHQAMTLRWVQENREFYEIALQEVMGSSRETGDSSSQTPQNDVVAE